MTFLSRMRYAGGRQDEAVHLRLANYPPVITFFRSFLGAHGSKRATAAGEASRHAHTAWRRTQKPRRGRERPWERQAARRRAARLGTALDIGEYTPYAMQQFCI